MMEYNRYTRSKQNAYSRMYWMWMFDAARREKEWVITHQCTSVTAYQEVISYEQFYHFFL